MAAPVALSIGAATVTNGNAGDSATTGDITVTASADLRDKSTESVFAYASAELFANGDIDTPEKAALVLQLTGADGVMIEVHPDPIHALCDGPQSLRPAEFAALAASLRALVPFVAEQRETVP